MRLFGQCEQVPRGLFPSFVTLLPPSEEAVARTILLKPFLSKRYAGCEPCVYLFLLMLKPPLSRSQPSTGALKIPILRA